MKAIFIFTVGAAILFIYNISQSYTIVSTYSWGAIILAGLAIIYTLMILTKKPISNRLGIFHALLTTSGVCMMAATLSKLHLTEIDAHTATADNFIQDLRTFFILISGLVLFVIAQVIWLLSLAKQFKLKSGN